MKLKKHNRTPGIEYLLTVYIDSKIDGIVFGAWLFIVTDENLLEKVIKNED